MMARKEEIPPHTELQNFGILMRTLNCKRLLCKQLGVDRVTKGVGPGRTNGGVWATTGGKIHSEVQPHRMVTGVKGDQEKLSLYESPGRYWEGQNCPRDEEELTVLGTECECQMKG